MPSSTPGLPEADRRVCREQRGLQCVATELQSLQSGVATEVSPVKHCCFGVLFSVAAGPWITAPPVRRGGYLVQGIVNSSRDVALPRRAAQ
jgi:hypothetical protein